MIKLNLFVALAVVAGLTILSVTMFSFWVSPALGLSKPDDLKQYGVDVSKTYVDENGEIHRMETNYTNAKSAAPDY
ncbi:MAG: hypothetical protein R2685_14270 [Candidatus Nitrosocosmicus sp.]|nr:hypothetical protein [Candidatus Nitrosocosmicus sp.]